MRVAELSDQARGPGLLAFLVFAGQAARKSRALDGPRNARLFTEPIALSDGSYARMQQPMR